MGHLDTFRRGIQVNMNGWEDAFQQAGNHQPQRHCKEGRHHEIQQGAKPQLAHFLDVVHRKDARHDGEQHQRYYDELQQVKENGAYRLDVRIDEVGLVAQQDTCQHGKQQSDANLGGKGRLFHRAKIQNLEIKKPA